MSRDVFVSHSAQDKKVAETICGALEQQGIGCWVAPRDVRPGKSFPGEITRAIQQTKVMLLIFSRHSNSSEQVLREVQLAVDCRVPIVRLRLEEIPLSDDLRYYLSTPQYLDALTTPLSKHIPPLVAAVQELLGPATEGPAAPRVIEPTAMMTGATALKPSETRKMPMIVWAIVVLAVLGFTMWSRLSKKSGSSSAPTPALEPTLTVAPSPVVSATPIAVQASPSPVAVATVTPSPAALEISPTPETKPSPSATEPNKKGPLPRNNRTWQAWMDEFVHNFIASNETNDVDLAMSFYAPTVDLLDEGKKSGDAIRRDIESYNVRWPSRRATIRGDVRLAEKAANHSYSASFEHDYYVENAGRGEWINGAVAVDLQIVVEGNGVPRIISMKQKTLRKEKGTMQPKTPAQSGQTPATEPASPASNPLPATIAPSTSAEPVDLANADPHLVRVRNTRYGFSGMVPATVFPNPLISFTGDRQAFTSADGRAILTFYVERNGSARHLRESYDRWSADHTKAEPDKIVDYKVLRDNWFVVSGQKGERGFYLKAVAKREVLEFMYLDCDENHYPVNRETLTAMSRSFDGN